MVLPNIKIEVMRLFKILFMKTKYNINLCFAKLKKKKISNVLFRNIL